MNYYSKESLKTLITATIQRVEFADLSVFKLSLL
jgi:hypothetical protein